MQENMEKYIKHRIAKYVWKKTDTQRIKKNLLLIFKPMIRQMLGFTESTVFSVANS